MKGLEALAPKEQNKNYRLSKDAKAFLAKRSRKVLRTIFRLARDRSRAKDAWFWRQVKKESWRLLAGPGVHK